jgi:hypothetical protein
MRAVVLSLLLCSAVPLAAQNPQAIRRGGGGNAENPPAVFHSWGEAKSASETAQNKYRVARSSYQNAKRAYDDLNDSGGMSTDKSSKLDALRRKKDDAYRTANDFRMGYRSIAQGAVNFATNEAKNATTDADKKTAAQHKSDAQRWLDEAGNGMG